MLENHKSKYPYTVTELMGASEQPPDTYHRHLMVWAALRIQELEEYVKFLEGKSR